MGGYQLYAETNKLLTRSVYLFLGLAVLLSIIPIIGSIYQLLLAGLAFYVVYPLLNPSRKYLFGLIFFTAAAIAHLINRMQVVPVVFLHAIDNLFRVGFYVILFDRVIELMEKISEVDS